jgi:hypothetical protein
MISLATVQVLLPSPGTDGHLRAALVGWSRERGRG